MVLYDNAGSGNCYKVRLLAAQLGIPLERRELDVVDRSDRQRVIGHFNPGLRIPTLVLDDGRAIGESGAILVYLAEGTELLPADRYERASVLQWMFFEQYSLEPYIAVARFWSHVAHLERSDEAWQEKRHGGERALEALESQLSGRAFLVGETYSIADIALYAYAHVAEEGGFDLSGRPAMLGWLERVRSQPGHITIDAA